MRKLLNNPWIVAALAVAALAFVGVSLRSQLSPRSGASGVITTGDVAAAESSPETPSADQRGTIQSALKELQVSATPRDPFFAGLPSTSLPVLTPKEIVPDSVDTVRLAAVWTQGGTTYVLINDRICQAGDEVAPFKIESASQEGVWLTHWKGRDFLSIGHDVTLVTPARSSAAHAL